MQLSDYFLIRSEWWLDDYTSDKEVLMDMFVKETETLDKRRLEFGLPINVDLEHIMEWSEVQQLHSWIDLLMWAIEGGTLDD